QVAVVRDDDVHAAASKGGRQDGRDNRVVVCDERAHACASVASVMPGRIAHDCTSLRARHNIECADARHLCAAARFLMPHPPISLPRPAAGEFDPAAAGYIARVSTITDGAGQFVSQRDRVVAVLSPLSDAQAACRYAPGKWSVAEIVGHLSDSERVLAYRLLRIGRGDETPLAGFDQDPYVLAAAFDRRALADVL